MIISSIDDIWSMDSIDLKNWDPKINKICREILVVVDTFNKSGWTISLENETRQLLKLSFGRIRTFSEKNWKNLFEIDDGKDIVIKWFNTFLEMTRIERSSRHTWKGAVLAKRFEKSSEISGKKLFPKENC